MVKPPQQWKIGDRFTSLELLNGTGELSDYFSNPLHKIRHRRLLPDPIAESYE